MKRLLVLAALVLPATASAHPGYVDIKNHTFRPQSLQVGVGVLVEWRWDGPDLNHSVTGENFDSDPGKQPIGVLHPRNDTFGVFFDKVGTYAYACKVHPEMTGTVVVSATPPPDRTPPRLDRLSAKVEGREAIVSFRIDEKASVLAEDGDFDAFRFVQPGTRSIRLKIPRGRSQVRVVATDDVGNRSRPRTVSVRR